MKNPIEYMLQSIFDEINSGVDLEPLAKMVVAEAEASGVGLDKLQGYASNRATKEMLKSSVVEHFIRDWVEDFIGQVLEDEIEARENE